MPDDLFDARSSGLLSIGELASLARLSHKALRLYDQLGLLLPARVDRFSGYRFYEKHQVDAARLIRNLRDIDMPLATIRKVLTCELPDQVDLIRDHQRLVAERAIYINSAVSKLLADLQNKEIFMSFQIEVEHLTSQIIASIKKQVFVSNLDAHISDSLRLLNDFSRSQKIMSNSAPFGIYHGPVNTEESGPVEVCLPISSSAKSSGDVLIRDLPACTAAVVTVHGNDCDFPAIIGAYDAIANWISKNGYKMADSPREIWLTQPNEQAKMQIVWPFVEK
jgi:DNA-binding transcriptional MerR regulator